MRLYEFILLLEYNRDITKQRLGDKLVAAATKDHNQDIDTILSSLELMDPTRNKKYVEWLAKQYIAGMFQLADAGRIKEILTHFDKLKPRLDQKDINQYTYRTLRDKIKSITDVDLSKNDSNNTGQYTVPPDTEVLYNGPYGLLASPKTEDASRELGRGTEWCTARTKSDNMFDTYNKKGPLYVWRDRNGEKYQFQFESGEFKDIHDDPIDHKQLNYFRTQHPVLSKFFKRIEKHKLTLEPSTMVSYAEGALKGRWPEAEPYIMKDPIPAYYYAKDVIKGRWPEAEPYIMKNPELTRFYLTDVVKGRWPEAEHVILQDIEASTYYMNNIIKGRWPEAEPVIMKDPYLAYYYAEDVIKGRWPEAEPYIMQNPSSAYHYAIYIIKGRWPEAEPYIMKDPSSAYHYARDVIKGRWPEAEPYIMQNPSSAYHYAKSVIGGRWPEAEPYIMKNDMFANMYKEYILDR